MQWMLDVQIASTMQSIVAKENLAFVVESLGGTRQCADGNARTETCSVIYEVVKLVLLDLLRRMQLARPLTGTCPLM